MIELITQELEIDANVIDFESPSWNISTFEKLNAVVCPETGISSDHVITVQISPNNLDWFDLTTITGINYEVIDVLTFNWIRGKVTVVAGSPSLVHLHLDAIRHI